MSLGSPDDALWLVCDPPADGPWNMAVDEALLEWSEATGGSCLRLYAWTPATLSLGYFQEAGQRRSHEASIECPMVRRSSGGGAIVHDRELTYGFVTPLTSRWGRDRLALYRHVHRALTDALDVFGISAELWGENAPCAGEPSARGEAGCQAERLEGDSCAFLCFARRAPGDVVLRTAGGAHFKIGGSAQRRGRSSLLQHGSILLARSPAAPELPGIEDFVLADIPGRHDASRAAFSAERLTQCWLDTLAARLRARWAPDRLPPGVSQRAGAIVTEKYASDAWTLRRGRAS